MEVDDEGKSLGWCFGVASLCAAVGSTGSLLLDSGGDELSCTPKFADTDRNKPGPQLPQTQGKQHELAINRPKDRAHDGGTGRWETVAGDNGHVPRRGGAGQYLVAGKAGQERFQLFVGSAWLFGGEGRQVCAARPGKEQFARGGPCVAASDEASMCGRWNSCRGRQHGSCGPSRCCKHRRAASRCLM